LSSAQLSLLAKGLNFCPTAKAFNLWDLKADFERLHRSLRLKHFFNPANRKHVFNLANRSHINSSQLVNLTDNSQVPTPGPSQTPFQDNSPDGVPRNMFRNKSNWNPKNVHNNIETFSTVNMANLTNLPEIKPKFHNLTKAEKQALIELRANSEIIIKPADKGAGTVVMNIKDYIFEAKKQLFSQSYVLSEKKYIDTANMEVTKVLLKMLTENSIDKKRHDFLLQKTPKAGKFYLLPKIHKNILPPPGRPIVSQIGSPTEKISGYLDFFIQPFLQKIPSYLKDTGHFLHIIEETNKLGKLPENTLLVTLDVTSLYTNIPIIEAKRAVAKALHDLRGSNATPSNQRLIELLDLILKHNIFTFSTGQEILYFLQIIGIAMGTKAAVAIANIFMHFFETNFFSKSHLPSPFLYKRFIDDIFMIWTHSKEQLTELIENLNSAHKTIKFTATISDTRIEFLDTQVYLENGVLKTELFIKPTNPLAYLLRSSYHPKHTFNSLPYGEFLRTRRNCSDLETFDKHARTIYAAFVKRGYRTEALTEALNKARQIDRTSLLEKYQNPDWLNQAFLQTQTTQTTQPVDSTFYFVTKYHDGIKPVQNILRDNWQLLGKSPQTEHLFESKLITGFRRNSRLRDMLVTTQIPLAMPTPGQGGKIIRECPDPQNCIVCPLMDTTGKITSPKKNKVFFSRHKAYCCCHNVIYCIQCNTCNKQYVGQTKREWRIRFKEHTTDLKKAILTDKDQPVAKHLTRPDHTSKIDQVTCYILDFIKAPSHSDQAQLERNKKERIWIFRLGTIRPHGLNTIEPKPFI